MPNILTHMKKVDVYNFDGKKVTTIALNAAVFDVDGSDAMIHQVYVAQAANRRNGHAHTKIRSDVRGGGKKPWRQKGTGNARTGSIRNPLWKGGGVIFGPTKDKNYTKDINIKVKKKAIALALTKKAQADKIRVVESLTMDAVKTKPMAALLQAMGVDASAVVAFAPQEAASYKAARNIARVLPLEAEKLNVYDVMNAQYIVLSLETLKQLDAKYAA